MGNPIYSSTLVAPALINRKFRYETYLKNNSIPIPEPGSALYNNALWARALSRGLRSGDQLQITQIFNIELAIDNPEKIDLDFRYYTPKAYIGTYQVSGGGGVRLGSTGFLEVGNGNNQIINQFNLQVVSEVSPTDFLHMQNQLVGQLDACNFDLLPSIIEDPITGTPTPGFSLKFSDPDKPAATLLHDRRFFWDGDIGNYPFPTFGNTGTFVLDFDYDGAIKDLDLYIYEGASIVSINEQILVDTLVPVIIPPTIARQTDEFPICGIGEPTCADLFQELLDSNPALYPTLAQCEANSLGFCDQVIWVCPSDSTQTFSYWITGGT